MSNVTVLSTPQAVTQLVVALGVLTTSIVSSAAIAQTVPAPVTLITNAETPSVLLTVLAPSQGHVTTLVSSFSPTYTPEVFLGKTLLYVAGQLSEVLLYADAAKSTLLKRKALGYTSGRLSTVHIFGPTGNLLSVRTLGYELDTLTSVVDT